MKLGSKQARAMACQYTVIAAALAHVGVLASSGRHSIASNVIQLISPSLAFVICMRRGQQAPDPYFRRIWKQLGTAFLIWAAAQGYFLAALVRGSVQAVFPSPADVLWLVFAFPVLIVTVSRRSRTRWEWVNWLDMAQVATFFIVLSCLVFSHPATISLTAAYDIQSVALLLACALRYSSTVPGPERLFFRNLGAYLLMYSLFSALGNRLQDSASGLRGWADFCWSFPLLIFCSLVLLTDKNEDNEVRTQVSRNVGLPKYLQGLSALGLSALSISAADLLQTHRPIVGLIALVFGYLIFGVRVVTREAQLQTAHDTVQTAACYDSLTGLANRKCLLSELEYLLGARPGKEAGVGVFFMDLDRFKAINDTLGHSFGDRLLIEVASILRSLVRPGDTVARLGGDEFVVLVASTNLACMQELAAAILQRFREPIHLEGRVLYVTASIGSVVGESGTHPDDLLRDADCAMYLAKSRGKDQEQTFKHEMVERATKALLLETDLRHAISGDELTCHYQPIYSVSEGTIVGFEALSRWFHPKRGSVSPAEFIPIAEETGLILALGKQTLRRACYEAQRWNQTSRRSLSMSINLSPKQFTNPKMIQDILEILEETGLPANLLTLEITESVLLNGSAAVVEVLNEARSQGIQISLDDFGTGYSSLSYLLHFPFDIVKIDRSFVQGFDADPRSAELVRTIVQLVQCLGKKVIAEGIETNDQRTRLQEMLCDLQQGYLYSKPLAPELVPALLALPGALESSDQGVLALVTG